MRITRGLVLAALAILFCAAGSQKSKELYPTAKGNKNVWMSTWFEADPSWPQRPEGFEYNDVPGVAVDKDDNVWIATRTSQPIHIFNSEGKHVRIIGEGILEQPHSITLDNDGNAWVVDTNLHVVLKFSPQGKVLMKLGVSREAGNDETHFNIPTDVAVAANGDIFVSDGYRNSRIVHFNSKGEFINSWGKFGQQPGEFDLPHAIALDSKGRIYVADRNNARVQVFEQSGKFIDQWRNIIVPWGLWMTKNDELWICGSSPMKWSEGAISLSTPPKDQVIMKFTLDGKVRQIWMLPARISPKASQNKGPDLLNAKTATKSGEVDWIHGIALDSKNNVYIGEIAGKNIQKFVPHTDPKRAAP